MSHITKPQTKKLRTLASKRFGDCDCRRATGSSAGYVCDYHRWLAEEFEVASTLALSFAQAGRAIDLLEGKKPKRAARDRSPQPWRGRYPVPGAPDRVTQAQADEVARLEDALGYAAPPPGACRQGLTSGPLQKLIGRQLGRPSNVHVPIHGLSREQATSLITGLRRLLDHNREQRA